jgi:hypothetical protein
LLEVLIPVLAYFREATVVRFKLPNGSVDSILPEATEMLLRVCPHEVGHAEVATHFGVRVHGIAMTQKFDGLEAAAIYETRIDMPLKDWCTIKAAGPAGEVIAFGRYSPLGASVDRQQVSESGYFGDFDALVQRAASILQTRRTRFDRFARLLKQKIFESNEVLTMEQLSVNRVGVYLLDEAALSTQRKPT